MFFDVRVSSMASFCHRTRWSISKSTKRSCGIDFAWEETKVVAVQIVAASPQQCTYSQCSKHPAVPGPEDHHLTGTTSLFTLLGVILSFPYVWGHHQRGQFWRCAGHQECLNNWAEGHHKRIPPAVQRNMIEKDGKVH